MENNNEQAAGVQSESYHDPLDGAEVKFSYVELGDKRVKLDYEEIEKNIADKSRLNIIISGIKRYLAAKDLIVEE